MRLKSFRDMRRYTKNPAEVRFEELLPLKLKDKVSGKGDRSKDRACVQEMFVMFACLKKNEFENARCSEEIKKFQVCATNNFSDKYKRKQDILLGNISTGSNNLSPREVNYLLQKFPNP